MKGWHRSRRAPIKGWKTRQSYWRGNDYAGWLGLAVAALFRSISFKRKP